MQDELDRVPADAIFYSEAFERVFDMWHPDAAELRVAIERTSVMTEASFKSRDESWARWNEAHRKWDKARAETQKWFRNQLAMGALDFYQRDPATGEKLRLHPDTFNSKYAFYAFSPDPVDPPVFFIEADFEKWREQADSGDATNNPAPASIGATKSAAKERSGRTPSFDWIDIEAFVFKKMDENGEFDKGSPGWRGQADLHRLIDDYLRRRDEPVPGNSVLYERISPMISRWREKKSSSGNSGN
jgi:hypothetical protein